MFIKLGLVKLMKNIVDNIFSPLTKNGTWVSNSYGKAFPLTKPNCPRW